MTPGNFSKLPRGLGGKPKRLPQPQGRCHSCCQLALMLLGWGSNGINLHPHFRAFLADLHVVIKDSNAGKVTFATRPTPSLQVVPISWPCPFSMSFLTCRSLLSEPRTTARHLFFQAASRNPGWPWGHKSRKLDKRKERGKGSQDMMRKRCVQREQAVLMEQENRKEN